MPRSANFLAEYILKAFDAYHEAFTEITGRAGRRFRNCDWQGVRNDAVERLELYSRIVDQSVSELVNIIGDQPRDETKWEAVKAAFVAGIRDRYHFQIAETFYNSVVRRVFSVIGVNPKIEFTVADFKIPIIEEKPCPVCSAYPAKPDKAGMDCLVDGILAGFEKELPFMDRAGDGKKVARAIDHHLAEKTLSASDIHIEVADAVFYRYKGAYLVGRILAENEICPLIICVLNIEGKIFVDAVLLETYEVSILFSFANAYFHVNVVNPEEMINFLKSIMPRKRVSEIYTSLGYHKHGKAELFRELTRSLDQTDDCFEIAPGEAGMVMLVFTIPALNVVFKIIRDRFEYPKKTTAEHIRNRYQLVFKHDRAGRLVDAQEYYDLKLDKQRFPENLLRELGEKASKNTTINADHVIIRHLYTERRLTPLDIFIRENSPEAVKDVLLDYGWAVKELAASNIFPGDLFFKNFGVTQWGRVVFYDYDELSLLTDCHFRKMPEPRSHEEIMSDEPWFAVNENDVFPEEFKKFLFFPEHVRPAFEEIHGDLFDVHFWREMQKQIEEGILVHILPYKNHRRFDHQILEASGIYFSRKI